MHPMLTTVLVLGLLAAALGVLAPGAAAPQENPETEYVAVGADTTQPGLAPGLRVTDLGPVTRVYEIRMAAGDELMSGLAQFAAMNQPKAGRITGIGGFASAVFAWYDPERGALKKVPVNRKGEVVSFTGSVSYENGEPNVHVHATISLSDGTVHGGHVLEARIAPIMQVVVFETEGPQ